VIKRTEVLGFRGLGVTKRTEVLGFSETT